MTLRGYEVKTKSADGKIYAVVTLEDGSTFGQNIRGAYTVEQIDAAIAEAVNRIAPAPQVAAEVDALVGVFRPAPVPVVAPVLPAVKA